MFHVHILGTSAAIPTASRYPTCQVVTINDRHHLLDCGESAQIQAARYRIRFSRLDAIFITHLHADHFLGLPGLLFSLSLNGRNFPLKIFAPRALKAIFDQICEVSQTSLAYELEFYATEDFAPGDVIYQKDRYEVVLLPLDHRIFCRGFLFREINKAPRFLFAKAKSLGVPNAYFKLLKQGNSVTLENGVTVEPGDVLDSAEAPVSYAYCTDTRPNPELIPYIKGVTTLYHESTFLKDHSARARETHHSTAAMAAGVAAEAEVKNLILGHYSARYTDLEPFLDEAREIFPKSELAVEGRVFNIRAMHRPDYTTDTPYESFEHEPDSEPESGQPLS